MGIRGTQKNVRFFSESLIRPDPNPVIRCRQNETLFTENEMTDERRADRMRTLLNRCDQERRTREACTSDEARMRSDRRMVQIHRLMGIIA